jgi:hypothetical protein
MNVTMTTARGQLVDSPADGVLDVQLHSRLG